MKEPSLSIISLFIIVAFLSACVPTARMPERPWVQGEIPRGKTPATLVWVVSPLREPQEIFDQLHQIFENNPNMRLVAAFDAASLELFNENQKAQILLWRNKNCLEIAITPPGSLPLPLMERLKERVARDFGFKVEDLTGYNEEVLSSVDIQRVILSGAELFQKAFVGEPVGGLIAPLGYIDGNFLKAASSGRYPWVLAASTSTDSLVLRHENLHLYLARSLESFDEEGSGIFVLDETYVLTRQQSQNLLADRAELVRREETDWFLVDLAYWRVSDQVGIPLHCHWGAPHSLDFLVGSNAQRLYWRILADVRRALVDYQNLGRANLALLDEMWKSFYALLDYRFVSFFRSSMILTPEAELRDREFRAEASAIHQRLSRLLRKKPKPLPLELPLWQVAEEIDSRQREPTAGVGGEQHLEFTDLHDAATKSSALDLEKVFIDWNADEFIFSVQFSSPLPLFCGSADLRFADLPKQSFENPSEADCLKRGGGAMLEFYIDLNNTAYEGKGLSLNGMLKVAPLDFWEYAVKVESSGKAFLYMYTLGSLKKLAEAEQTLTCQENRCIAKIPRERIRGRDPSSWGWALAFWADDEKTLLDTLASGEGEEETLFFSRK